MPDKKIGDLKFGVVVDGKEFAKGTKQLSADTKNFDKSTQGATKSVTGMGTALKKVGTALVGLFALAKIIQYLKRTSEEAKRFESEMRRINTVTQLSKKDLEALGDELKGLSKNIGAPLAELQAGLFDVASAGIEAKSQIDFLTASVAFAKVGAFDTATAVQGLTAVLKGYGAQLSETENILNLFLQTNVKGQTTLGELAEAVQGISGLARNAGVSMEEFFAILATGTGVTGGAKEVATQLRGTINALVAPTIETSKRFKELGIEVGKSAVEKEGLVAVAKKVYDAVGGDAEQLRRLIPEVEATTLVIALATTQNEKFNENLRENRGEMDLVARQYTEYALTAEGQSALIKNAFDRVAGSIGNIINRLGILFYLLAKNPLGAIENVGANIRTQLDKASFSVSNLASTIANKFAPDSKASTFLEETTGKLAINFNNSVKSAEEGFAELLSEDAIGQLKESLNGLTDSAQTFGSETTSATDKVAGGMGGASKATKETAEDMVDFEKLATESIDEVAKGYDDWQRGIKDTEKRLEELRDRNEEFMNDIRKSIDGVVNDLKGLEQSFESDIAGEVIKAQEKLKELQEELMEEDLSDERKKDIEEEIKAQQALIESAGKLREEGLLTEEAIAEAQRKAGLNAIQLKAEEFQKEKEVLDERKALLEAIKEGEEINLEEIKDFKNKQMAEELMEQKNKLDQEVAMVQNQQIAIQQAWIDGANAIHSINRELINQLDEEYRGLAVRIKQALSQASHSARSGEVMTGFQTGGFTGMAPTNKPVGVVHGGEFVANARLVRDNKGLFDQLDKIQRKGFQDGGMVTNNNQRTVNLSPTIHSRVGLRAVLNEARFHLR